MQDPKQNTILIEFVANGVVVSIPDRTVLTDEYEEYLIKKQARKERIFMEEAGSENEIERMQRQGQGRADSVIPSKQFRKLSVSDISDKTIHSFPTLPEALTFLANEFKD